MRVRPPGSGHVPRAVAAGDRQGDGARVYGDRARGTNVGRMATLMGRARRAALGKPGRGLPAGCGESLDVMFQDAVSRAATFQQGG